MTEDDISKVLEADNDEFKALKGEHQSLKSKLAEFKEKVHLTPEEESEVAELKKLKLTKKDRMAEMISGYKAANA